MPDVAIVYTEYQPMGYPQESKTNFLHKHSSAGLVRNFTNATIQLDTYTIPAVCSVDKKPQTIADNAI